MKFLIGLLILASTLSATAFTSGTYNCIEGNDKSICPQKMVVKTTSGTTTLSVVYSGYCNDQGPYRYACQTEKTCEDLQISFTQLTETSYQWVNKSVHIFCRFERAQ